MSRDVCSMRCETLARRSYIASQDAVSGTCGLSSVTVYVSSLRKGGGEDGAS